MRAKPKGVKYRGPLLALVDELRRLRRIVLEGRSEVAQHEQTEAL